MENLWIHIIHNFLVSKVKLWILCNIVCFFKQRWWISNTRSQIIITITAMTQILCTIFQGEQSCCLLKVPLRIFATNTYLLFFFQLARKLSLAIDNLTYLTYFTYKKGYRGNQLVTQCCSESKYVSYFKEGSYRAQLW